MPHISFKCSALAGFKPWASFAFTSFFRALATRWRSQRLKPDAFNNFGVVRCFLTGGACLTTVGLRATSGQPQAPTVWLWPSLWPRPFNRWPPWPNPCLSFLLLELLVELRGRCAEAGQALGASIPSQIQVLWTCSERAAHALGHVAGRSGASLVGRAALAELLFAWGPRCSIPTHKISVWSSVVRSGFFIGIRRPDPDTISISTPWGGGLPPWRAGLLGPSWPHSGRPP